MSTQTTQDVNLNTKPVQFIDFHGITLAVVDNENIQYVAVKPIVDLISIDWKSARRALFTGDNPHLFGTTELFKPVFDQFGGDIPPKKALYIRLDRSEMYLSRVDTSKMRAHGNIKAADALLKLQVEWAEALHNYETKGMAFKSLRKDKDLFGLIHKLDSVKNVELKAIYAKQLNDLYGLNITLGQQGSLDI